MIQKATPRPATGTQRSQSAPNHKRLIASIAPHYELTGDYVVIAALLHHPDLAAPYVPRLHPSDWALALHRIIARIALTHLRTLGRVDHRQLAAVLHDAGTMGHDRIQIELATLARMGELILAGGMVADAVAALTAYRRGALK